MLPEAFLDVADELAHIGGPGRLRSAVSRAYYAVFHVASEASTTLGAPRSNSHEVIGDRFQTSDDPEISALGQRFLNLEAARHHADNKISRPGGVEEPSSVMVHLREAPRPRTNGSSSPSAAWSAWSRAPCRSRARARCSSAPACRW